MSCHYCDIVLAFLEFPFIFWLVVWNIVYFPFHIWDVILPIDELIFFKMVIAPPTRYPLYVHCIYNIYPLL